MLFASQQHGGVALSHEDNASGPDADVEDARHPEEPRPLQLLRDDSDHKRAQCRPELWYKGRDREGFAPLLLLTHLGRDGAPSTANRMLKQVSIDGAAKW